MHHLHLIDCTIHANPQDAVELVLNPELARAQKISLAAPTLEKLLDYRDDDTDDSAFEVIRGSRFLGETWVGLYRPLLRMAS